MRKLTKTPKRVLDLIHLLFASFWFGGFAIMFICSIMLSVQAIDTYFGFATISLIQEIIKVCIPGLMVTGLLYGFVTKWGFFTHGWIVAKWLLTIVLVVATALVPINPICLGGVVAGMIALFALSVFKPRKTV